MKIKISKTTIFAVLAVACVLFMAGCKKQAQEYTIEVGGSTSVTPLMELFAAEYSTLNPNIKVNINGTGSGDGIRNAGVLYQVGMSSL